jgi:hypothetical protein
MPDEPRAGALVACRALGHALVEGGAQGLAEGR